MIDSMYMVLPPDIESLEELEYWHNKFMQLTYYQRKTSNDISIAQFGESNITRYNKMKSEFLNKYDEDYNNQYRYISDLLSYVSETADSGISVIDDNQDDKVARIKAAEDQGLVIMYPINLNQDSIYNSDEEYINAYKAKWDKFNSLSQEQRTLSDQTALAILGMDNYNLYNKTMNDMLEYRAKMQDPNHTSHPELYHKDAHENDINTYYTPEEMGNSKSSSTLVSESGKILDKYKWVATLESLTTQLKYTNDKAKIRSIKEQMHNLWWNPEIPFSVEAASRTGLRKRSIRLSESVNDCDLFTLADELMLEMDLELE